MSSLFSESSIGIMRNIKKGFLWTAVCLLIGEVVIGAILILTQTFNDAIGKVMATFALCSIALFVGVNNFSRMEKNDMIVQIFALICLISNLAWLSLSFMFIWGGASFTEPSTSWMYSSKITTMAKILSISIDIALMSFCISNTWAIEETVKPVRPLKITALICALYCGVYSVIATIGDFQTTSDGRWNALAGLAWFAFLVMVIAASIVSKGGKKKINKETSNANSADVQAQIQEMVEKEVQEKLKEERKKAELEAMPPLQSDDLPPSVSHDNDLKSESSSENSSDESGSAE